jgi:hypothetical protein
LFKKNNNNKKKESLKDDFFLKLKFNFRSFCYFFLYKGSIFFNPLNKQFFNILRLYNFDLENYYFSLLYNKNIIKYISIFYSNLLNFLLIFNINKKFIYIYNYYINILLILKINKKFNNNLLLNFFFNIKKILVNIINIFNKLFFSMLNCGFEKLLFYIYEFKEKLKLFLKKIKTLKKFDFFLIEFKNLFFY